MAFAAPAQDFPLLNHSYASLFGRKIWGTYVDSANTLWVGTDNGMYKYDGVSVKHFTVSDGLEDNEVLDFWGEENGRLWIWTFTNRLCFIDLKTDRLYNSRQFSGLNLRVPFVIKSVAVSGNELLVVPERNQVVKINPQQLMVEKLPDIKNVWLACRDQRTREIILVAGHNNCSGIFRLDKGKWQLVCEHEKKIIPGEGGYALLQDTVFYLGKGSFSRYRIVPPYNTGSEQTKLFVFPGCMTWILGTAGDFLIADSTRHYEYTYHGVSDISKDRLGNFWIATAKDGVVMVPWYYRQVNIGAAPDSERFRQMMFVNGAMMVYSSSGKYYRFDTALTLLGNCSVHKDNELQYIHRRGSGNWCFFSRFPVAGKTFNAGCNIALRNDDGHIIADTTLGHTGLKWVCIKADTCYLCVPRGLVVATLNGRHITADYILKKRCMAVCLDNSGTLWYASLNGLHSYRNGVHHNFPQPGPIAVKLLSVAGSDVLVSCGDNKLFLFDTMLHRYRNLTIPGGEQNYPLHIFDADSCSKFLVTNEHIFLLTFDAVHHYTFTYADVLGIDQHDIINMKCHNGLLYILTPRKCYSCPLHIITAPKTMPVPELVRVEYTTARRKERNIVPGNTKNGIIKLPPDASGISLFIHAHAAIYKDVEMQYAIENVKTSLPRWEQLSRDNINIPLPQYGKTFLYIRIRNASSGWSTPQLYTMDIAYPFWYDYRLVAVTILLLLALLLYCIVLLTRRYVRKKEREQLNAVAALHNEFKALNAMMNPHFVFNCLNSIQSFINTGDRKAANDYLQVFSRLLRQNMSNISSHYIPLHREIEIVENYMEIEKLRFDTPPGFRIVIENDDLLHCYIPPLMIQPVVENAIVHGLLPQRSTQSNMTLTIGQRGSTLVITVTDNGVGYYNTKTKLHPKPSLGIAYIVKRLEHIRQITGTGSVEIKSVSGEPGTTVVLVLPDDLELLH